MEPRELDPDAARHLLARAEASSASARSAMRRDRYRHARFSAFVGLAMAAYLLVTMVFVQRAGWLWALALVLYVVGIVTMAQRFNRLRVSAPAQWQRRYRNAVIVALVFYLSGIALNTALITRHHWPIGSTLTVAIPLCLATTAPLLFVAYRTVRDAA